ncbi:MAG: TadE/TadG family type IV pilus assembly protein, partial [Myxococcota bacterium]
MTRRGAQMVEFALLFPFLIVLVTGVIDVGWYLSTEVALIEAVRAGAWRGSRTLQGESPLSVAVVASADAWSFG